MNDTTPIALVLAGGLASLHAWGRRLSFLDTIPRSRLLSAAGGISVAYVFVHVLPDLAAGQESIEASIGSAWQSIEHHVYLIAMSGLVLFYGVERIVKQSKHQPRAPVRASAEGGTASGVFWVHVGAFAALNALIGYLLFHREESGVGSLLLYGGAMGTHFLVNDIGLRSDHKRRYDRTGRWVLSTAVLAGAVVGAVTEISASVIAALFAFLAGGVILNVLKEELPAERQSNFGAFLVGVGAFTLLLLVT